MADTIPFIVPADDPSLVSERVQYQGKAGNVTAYLSRPKEGGKLGGVIVIHEVRGLVDHIKDVARRFAQEGFVALAPDLLSRSEHAGPYKTVDEAVQAIRKLSQEGVMEDLNGSVAYLKKLNFVNGRVGVVGYCWGGKQSLNLAAQCQDLNAAVFYYGGNPDPLDLVQNISCPLLGNYAEDDPNVMPGVAPLQQALKKYGKNFDIKIYPGVKHAFNNNNDAERYHPGAAKDAWSRTVNFLKTSLAD